MYTPYYSPGSALMASHGVLKESGAPYTLVPVVERVQRQNEAT